MRANAAAALLGGIAIGYFAGASSRPAAIAECGQKNRVEEGAPGTGTW